MQEFRKEIFDLLKKTIQDLKDQSKLGSELDNFPVEISKIIQGMNLSEFQKLRSVINDSFLKMSDVKNINYSLGRIPDFIQKIIIVSQEFIDSFQTREASEVFDSIVVFFHSDSVVFDSKILIKKAEDLEKKYSQINKKILVLRAWLRLALDYSFRIAENKRIQILKDWELVVLKD